MKNLRVGKPLISYLAAESFSTVQSTLASLISGLVWARVVAAAEYSGASFLLKQTC